MFTILISRAEFWGDSIHFYMWQILHKEIDINGEGQIPNFSNMGLHDDFSLTPAIALKILFWELKILLPIEESPQNKTGSYMWVVNIHRHFLERFNTIKNVYLSSSQGNELDMTLSSQGLSVLSPKNLQVLDWFLKETLRQARDIKTSPLAVL